MKAHKKVNRGRVQLKLLSASALLLMPMFFATGQTETSKPGPSGADANLLPDGPGKDVVLNKCTSCHNIRNVIAHHGDADDWAQEVSKMIGRGANISDDDADTIVNYLAAHFGPSSPKAGDSSSSAPSAAHP